VRVIAPRGAVPSRARQGTGPGPVLPGATLGSVGIPAGFALAGQPGALPSGWSGGNTASSYYITGNNVVVDGYDFTSPGELTKNVLTVQGANATIRRCRFAGPANRAIDTMAAGAVTIEDCEFVGNFDDAAISGPDWTAERCDFHGMGNDAVKMGDDTVLRHCHIHDFVTVTGGHGDGIQGIDTPYGVTVYNCLIDLGTNPGGTLPNSAVIITPWSDPKPGPYGISFDHCTFGGGNLTVHIDLGDTAGISVTNCKFLDNYGPDGAPIQNTDNGTPIPAPAVFTGNVKHDGVTPLAWTDTSA